MTFDIYTLTFDGATPYVDRNKRDHQATRPQKILNARYFITDIKYIILINKILQNAILFGFIKIVFDYTNVSRINTY
jgi:hypothetical protein